LPIYHGAAAACLPSVREGFPNAVGEAMACGLPVLASNIGGIPELVDDPNTGFLFDPHDCDDIAASFDRFMNLTTDERLQMGRTARQYVEANLSTAVFADRYEAVLGVPQSSARAA
jgi:glycosyltransferase involved in cell wall biosynthesis